MEQPLRCGADASGGKLPLIERKAPFLKNKALLTTTIDCTDIQSAGAWRLMARMYAHACEGRFRGRGVEGFRKAET